MLAATLTAAMIFAAVVLVYYFVLDVPLALAMLAVTGILVWVGHQLAALSTGWIWFGILFVGGWILQLVGHVFEGASRRWPTIFSRSSSRRSSWRPKCSCAWATSRAAPRVQRRAGNEKSGSDPDFS